MINYHLPGANSVFERSARMLIQATDFCGLTSVWKELVASHIIPLLSRTPDKYSDFSDIAILHPHS